MTDGPRGEIEELEAIVRAAERSLAELQPNDARVFMEELAHRSGQGVLDVASAPPRLRALSGHLTDNGVFVVENGQVRFARPEVRDYLAACHVVRRHPRGPRGLTPTAIKSFFPRKKWPWPDDGVQAFLAALWWRPARPAVERRLRILLHKRHRDPNTRFLVDLLRRDLIPGNELRQPTIEVLRTALHDDALDDERWSVWVTELQSLDPAVAADELDAVVSSAGSTTGSGRRFQAVVALLDDDRLRGMKALKFLARNPTGTDEERLRTAHHIRELDEAEGVIALQQLVGIEDMGDRRIDAAIALGRPDLLSDLITARRGPSDEARFQGLGNLLAMDREAALGAAEQFAATAAAQETPLRIAELVRPFDHQAALRIATRTAERDDARADSEVRYRAVLLIGEIEPAQAVPALHRLSESKHATFEVALRAALRIVATHHGPIDAIVALATASHVAWANQADAAEAIKETHPETSAGLLVKIARSGPPTDAGRFGVLQRAHKIDPRQAVGEIVELVKGKLVAGPLRLRAADYLSSSVDTATTVALYAEIVDTADTECARKAADRVIAMNHPDGRRLMGRVADRPKEKDEFRLAAACEAGPYGKNTLLHLAFKGRPDMLRLRAAQALIEFDRSSGRTALEKLVERATPDQVRIQAARSLPGTAVLGALTRIACDSGAGEGARVDATYRVWDIDPKRGRQLAEALANQPGISPKSRQRIQYDLQR
ncbi:hypothetical protein M8542_31975 [Amycolatopsis sp. OK19-0408]|uniref:HEAT repeat domain-containing protein n=1 Tax=Amycolatopsis iheyensis TaxID=2945988 RepID=A0A9X2NMA1_9PSEU|nr:hypothetical protein [Amycolatopsis iheyensis]MCR6487455.1 hypothetical protein [Amycolatopsis iheyensis]